MANEAIRVKALEWMEDEPAHDQIDERVFVTVGGLGRYSVHVRTNGQIHAFFSREMTGSEHSSVEDAKAACQADFARRVGECVEVDDVDNTDALQARCAELEAAALSVLAHLTAAVSVIKTSEENGNHPSCAYGSDTMYRMAMKDFDRCMEAGRKALRSVVDGG